MRERLLEWYCWLGDKLFKGEFVSLGNDDACVVWVKDGEVKGMIPVKDDEEEIKYTDPTWQAFMVMMLFSAEEMRDLLRAVHDIVVERVALEQEDEKEAGGGEYVTH